MKKQLILIFIAGLCLLGCDPDRVYEENKDISDAIWRLDDVQRFDFAIEDAQKFYDLSFNIRNTLAYPFQNIYVKYELLDSTNNILQTDMKQFYLFDPKSGEPQGDGMGDLFDNQFPLIEGHQFTSPGNYSVNLQQFMRLDSLPMVVSVGLRVSNSTTAAE